MEQELMLSYLVKFSQNGETLFAPVDIIAPTSAKADQLVNLVREQLIASFGDGFQVLNISLLKSVVQY